MQDDPDADTPTDETRTGAFVLRVWVTQGSVRARVRSILDLDDRDAAEVVDLLGPSDVVVGEAVRLLQRWLDDITGDAAVTPP